MITTKQIIQSLAWMALAGVLPVCADWQETLRSPDGTVEVSVCAKGRRLSWRVARKGATLFDDSEIGLEFKGQKPFGAFTVANRSERAFDTSWETRLYKKRVVRDHGRELKLELAEADAPGRRVDILSPGAPPVPAEALAVEEDYSLLVRLEDGSLHRLSSGEVSVKL